MKILFLLLSLVSPELDPASANLAFTIERDRGSSSDHLTLCRVRVVNYGAKSWSGRSLNFEARAFRDGVVAATERGRFGLTLPPYGSLETMIGFTGRFERFEVAPIGRASGERRPRARAPRGGGKPRSSRSRAG